MFLYITLGTNDLARARPFYAAIMAALGHRLIQDTDGEFGYGPQGADHPTLYVTLPFDGKPASVGNGSMPALDAPTRAAVDAFHTAALAHGGTDEGAPGLRYGPTFYSCYVRDPDGNKLSAVCDRAE
ncbi:MAG: VOC family protein [Paracoccaceae bacterium]|jgi:catechol 2,3-dioxygenase-like lactoylglutathione lyase family enzyme